MSVPPETSNMSRPSSGLASPRFTRSRTLSFSSDRPSAYSASGSILMFPPLQISPEAAFIAESAASQIVTNDHDAHADAWYDQHGVESSSEPAIVTPGALALVNTFLDQLLFNFLHHARGTSLPTLRPAVAEVLKPKLAKDAIKLADEELREYLGGSIEDDNLSEGNVLSVSSSWDQELVWKRTRLRCMVYSSLGDLEEEDEDFFLDQDGLDVSDEANEVVSPAVAIFLTAILEFMGEQALVIAGQAAYQRTRSKFEKDLTDGSRTQNDTADRIVVEELDMERVALDRTLGRLWRAWKKRIRTPNSDSPRDSFTSRHIRSSVALSPRTPPCQSTIPTPPEVQIVAPNSLIVEPENIPLPLTDNDVNEIEAPGMVAYSEDEKPEETGHLLATDANAVGGIRPQSFMMLPSSKRLSYFMPVLFTNDFEFEPRKRSNSLPPPETSSIAVIGNAAPSTTIDSVDFVGPETSTSQQHVCKDVVDESSIPSKEETLVASKTKDPKVSTKSLPSSDEPASPRLVAAVSDPASLNAMDRENKRKTRALQAPLAIQTGIPLPKTLRRTDLRELGTDDELDELDEEPEILTSARVSITGSASASASPNLADATHSFTSKCVQRTNSAHSARIIEVSGPKSPVASRASSIDTLERVRTSSASRTSSVSASPILEEQEPLEAFTTPAPSAPRIAERNLGRTGHSKPNSPVIEQQHAQVDGDVHRTELTIPAHNNIDLAQSPTLPKEDLQNQLKHSQQQQQQQQQAAALEKPANRHSPNLAQSTNMAMDMDMDMDMNMAHAEQQQQRDVTRPTRSSSMQQNAMNHGGMGESYRPHMPSILSSQPSIHTILEDPSPTQMMFNDGEIDTEAPRPIHTSGSSGSGAGNKLKIVRTSEESSIGKTDNVARNFEELIQSDETIQYTLTPENMRNINDSPRSASPGLARALRRTNTGGESIHSHSSSTAMEARRKPSVVSMFDSVPPNPLYSHPIPQMPGSIRPQASLPSKLVRGVNAARDARDARDARITRDSTLDFAEFIRSTGPPGGDNPPFRPATLARSNSMRTTHSASARLHTSRSIDSTNRKRLIAREPTMDKRDNNSDLIEFIRRGPPCSFNNGAQALVVRSPTAPAASVMPATMARNKLMDFESDSRHSRGSTRGTDISVNGSVTSQTALLKQSASTGFSNGTLFDQDMPMPKRKTRRVRDPYAIDFSDEEDLFDEENIALGIAPSRAKPATKEESLADFLRNCEPPPEQPVVPPLTVVNNNNNPRPTTAVPKKSSMPSLIGRFSRGGLSRDNTPPVPSIPGSYDHDRGVSRAGSVAASVSSRGYIPIKVHMPSGYDVYGPIETDVSSSVPSPQSRPSMGSTTSYGSLGISMGFGSGTADDHRPSVSTVVSGGAVSGLDSISGVAPPRMVPMKRFEAREPVAPPRRTETSDLAEFLRSTTPPGMLAKQEEVAGHRRMFSRRKKPTVA